jgi:hypothetical protein
MNKDGPNGSPYGTLVKHDQSETKRDSASNNQSSRKGNRKAKPRGNCVLKITKYCGIRYMGIQVTQRLKYVDKDNAEARRVRGFQRRNKKW